MPLRNGPLVRRSLALFSVLGYYCLIENTIAVLIMEYRSRSAIKGRARTGRFDAAPTINRSGL